jgi:arginase
MVRMAETMTHLRLLWPQWQGAGTSSVREFADDLPFDDFRRGYAVGTSVLEAVLPAHDGPTATVPVEMSDVGLDEHDGIEAKRVVLAQLRSALDIIRDHDPDRITTLGGECSVSMAPFAALAEKYGDDLAILWVDSHPDMGTGESAYSGYHAMVVSALTGHGDAELLDILPATVPADRVALVGMHDWTDDAHPPTAAEWGLTVFPPKGLRTSSERLLDWIRETGATKVAIHFDVDTIDGAEMRLGLGKDDGGLSSEQARRVVRDVERNVDVVAMTIAEYVPRQVLQMRRALRGFPLLG